MGLDNGICVKSDQRKITREMLPTEIEYCWDEKYDTESGPEILYWRKNWDLRNADYEYRINTVDQVFEIIKIINFYTNKEIWEDSDTIWEYEDYLPVLRQNIINLTLIASFMKDNPDVYLIFYDSY